MAVLGTLNHYLLSLNRPNVHVIWYALLLEDFRSLREHERKDLSKLNQHGREQASGSQTEGPRGAYGYSKGKGDGPVFSMTCILT
jgi:hypothetical protein